jgi:hypothetical protein
MSHRLAIRRANWSRKMRDLAPSTALDSFHHVWWPLVISADGIALEKGMIVDPSGRILAESFHTRWTAGPDQLPSP